MQQKMKIWLLIRDHPEELVTVSPQVETLHGFPLAQANASLTLYDDTKKKSFIPVWRRILQWY